MPPKNEIMVTVKHTAIRRPTKTMRPACNCSGVLFIARRFRKALVSCVGFGNQDCISQVRLNLTNSGKQILNESYLGEGVFKISCLDPSRGKIFNLTITTDCNCQLINVKISDIE